MTKSTTHKPIEIIDLENEDTEEPLETNKSTSKTSDYAILYVHSGQHTRGPVSEELWDKVFNIFNLKSETAVLQGKEIREYRRALMNVKY